MGSCAALTTTLITKAAATILACAGIGIRQTASAQSERSFSCGGKVIAKTTRAISFWIVLAILVVSSAGSIVRAEDAVEAAGIGVGQTAGNVVFLPAKIASVSIGWLSGALSYVLTGGNADLTKQIWRDTSEGPYLITPEVARKAVGQRPELEQRK